MNVGRGVPAETAVALNGVAPQEQALTMGLWGLDAGEAGGKPGRYSDLRLMQTPTPLPRTCFALRLAPPCAPVPAPG